MYIFEQDPYLKPYAATILRRYEKAQKNAAELQDKAADFQSAFNDHLYYGLHKTPAGWVMREYMPNAAALYLIGDFSGWQPMPEYQFQKKVGGEFELTLPAETLSHLSLYKLYVEWHANGQLLHGERLSAWSKRCVQDPQTFIFSSQVWDPQQPYQWQHNAPSSAEAPLIYEAHVGMASERGEVASFAHFTQHILPYIADLGYNAVQLMAIQEHPYYGSFGYQVSNFFAVSSRFGTPDELKELVDTAHALGLRVIMDIVHSHAVSNEVEGLGCYDGSDHLFCHSGKRGQHSAWNSRCFDYGKDNVLHFLLANCKYWLEEFRFDGFRFDGVTSMLY
ncbi:MAG: 1,4-alpha-glucan-branching enzyme, partial [Bacteroidales bacterium]|nr:1,4-alpha-glucan-branching enzyme [Bacteroidales bacterium]